MPHELEDITIEASSIHAAAGEIIGFLEDARKGNVIYFHGWNGLGASATLRVVAQRLKSGTRLNNFEKVIHVDCSLWKSKRALQKAVGEELELPESVMAIFDQHDEEDDFDGLEQGSRGAIEAITREIFIKLANSRFVVIFINGSRDYIDLFECGVFLADFLNNKVLWTFGGRFRMFPALKSEDEEKIWRQNDVFVEVDNVNGVDFVREEADEVANYTGIADPAINHEIVEECFLYVWALRDAGGIDWGTHASNYWVCDGIVQGNNTSAWEIGDALHRITTMVPNWEWFEYDIHRSLQRRSNGRLILATRQFLQQHDSDSLPAGATSLFILAAEPPTDTTSTIPAAMFQCSEGSRLRVIHLSWCMFSFASPPFLCCNNLRFLLLDHCKDENTNITEEHQSHNKSRLWKACFGNLSVLDLSYTEWYSLLSEEMMNIMAGLRELNVKGLKHWSISDLRGSGASLVKLRVTSHTAPDKQTPFPDLSGANNLKMVILEGCVGLEQVGPNVLPPSLESFSFVNKDDAAAAAAKISIISFRGCAHLNSIVLRGMFGRIEEIDLSGTAVKTLDLSAVRARHLKRVILLGCDKLRAILWPPEDEVTRQLEVLQIDTTRSASSLQAIWEQNKKEARTGTGSSSSSAATKPDSDRVTSFDFNISTRDARLLRSTRALFLYGKDDPCAHIEIASSPEVSVARGGSNGAQGIRSLQPSDYYIYAKNVDRVEDAFAFEGVAWEWGYPRMKCYIHIQDEEVTKSGLLQQQGSTEQTSTGAALLPTLLCDKAMTLHVHDSLSITSIIPSPLDSSWDRLRWCRVERCPKLHTVFTFHGRDDIAIFWALRAFWASQLSTVRYIWKWSAISQPTVQSFKYLKFLHLDNCPRLIHVLPLPRRMTTLKSLETLEIVCCGDLRDIFPLDPGRRGKQVIIEFPRLKRIHLHELPMLQRICGLRMSAPNLETIRIRGCWGLRHLPSSGGKTKVDCEKDWWDNLKWEGLPDHHPSLYQPIHSLYYKNRQLPRGTVLR